MDKEQFSRIWQRVSGESCPLWGTRPDVLSEQLRLCAAVIELYTRLGYHRFCSEKEAELRGLQTEYFLLTAETLPLLPRYSGESEKIYLLREAINLEERSAALKLNPQERESCLRRARELRRELGRML